MGNKHKDVFTGLGIAVQDLLFETLFIENVYSLKFDVLLHQPLVNFNHFPSKIEVDEQQYRKQTEYQGYQKNVHNVQLRNPGANVPLFK